ncbi:hypothetical protein AX769_08260 [Frondihabitans sp. PAMC 28766]|uniref:hypothetical protein n=1 Tax=Frondihabitans sp. PAMC 28766 TaxID=1795630 RepID=UPI00078B184B|nr:hypothetical protein [Frondihabitans sp. PAMC 28766]AMM20160.1 hypothetical protein AX769_08260 [Frondihabitans sp. PAMC 28766]
MTTPTTDRDLRPLGAFERTIDLYAQRNPVQFSVAVQLARDVTESDLAAALERLQEAHPLVAAEIGQSVAEGEEQSTQVFRRSDRPIPIRLARGSTWQHEAAVEQTIPIRTTPGPLVRSVLIPAAGAGSSTGILLTFAHQIADGRGALIAVADLAASLGGTRLSRGPVPEPQEQLVAVGPPIDDTASDTHGADLAVENTSEQSQTPAGRLRPFDGDLPTLQAAELTTEQTRLLVRRAREESCTVQAALCAAAAAALFAQTELSRVRINVPIDLRSVIDGHRDVGIRFIGATVTLDRGLGISFWEAARAAAGQLQSARRPQALRAAALGLAQVAPTTPAEAEAAMLAATTADIEITNLGVVEMDQATAVWGPTMTTQVENEQILGVVTHGDALRMVNTTRAPIEGLTTHISRALASAVSED